MSCWHPYCALDVPVDAITAVFSTVYSGGPTADAIHNDAVLPAAAFISDFNSIPALAGIHAVLAVLLSSSFLLL